MNYQAEYFLGDRLNEGFRDTSIFLGFQAQHKIIWMAGWGYSQILFKGLNCGGRNIKNKKSIYCVISASQLSKCIQLEITSIKFICAIKTDIGVKVVK